MLYRNTINCLLTSVAVGALVLGTGYREAIAEEAAAPEEAAPNTGAISLNFQNDFTTAYFFRGILQERDGLIWEPSIGINFKLFGAEEGIVRGVTLSVGNWDSIQSKETFNSGAGPQALYESDYYPSLTMNWAGGVTTAFYYYFYTSPNGAFHTTEEADLVFSLDDSPYLGVFALKPSATFAFETHGSSLGSGKGNMVQLGIAPSTSVTIPGCDSYPIAITMPVTLGLSMDDYYKYAGSNNVFGYAAIGVNANVPLAFIPKRYGAWSITNGVNVLFLGDGVETMNHSLHGATTPGGNPANGRGYLQSDAVYPVWTSSLVLAY